MVRGGFDRIVGGGFGRAGSMDCGAGVGEHGSIRCRGTGGVGVLNSI